MNTIGYPLHETISVTDFVNDDIDRVYEHDNEDKGWTRWFSTQPDFGELEKMRPGRGYVIFADEDTVLEVGHDE